MEDIRILKNLYYQIESPGYVSVVRNENFTFPYLNGKDFYSFIFVQRGSLEYNSSDSDKKLHIQKNDVLYIPKKHPYVTKYLENNTKIQILNFNVANIGNFSFFNSPMLIKSPDVVLLFNSITLQNMQSPLFLSSKIYELLYLCEVQKNLPPNKYSKIAPAIHELNQFYFKNEKISYYANLCDMSESNFRKVFKEYTGNSPIEYRNLIRIKNVKRFISSKEFTMSEAAYLAGFNNMAFFYEVYNKYK